MSDNEPTFVSSIIQDLTTLLGIQRITTIPYRPQGNSPVESFHKHLDRSFNKIALKNITDIHEAIHLALFSHRVVIHSATLESPAFLLYGLDPLPPQDGDWRFVTDQPLHDRVRYLNQVRRDILQRALGRRNQILNEQESIQFRVADLVVTRATPAELYQHALRTQTALKLIPKCPLPCRIVHISSNGARVTIRFLLSGQTRLVHFSTIRKIAFPKDEHERKMWNEQFDMVSRSWSKRKHMDLDFLLQEVHHLQMRYQVCRLLHQSL